MWRLLTLIFTFCLGFAGLCSVAFADVKVVKTVPPDQAKAVDPALTQILIAFSEPVKQNSWSFVETGKGRMPEITDDPFFLDNKICVLPVSLKPGVTYSVGINSDTRKGFKSAANEKIAVTPYVLTFATSKSEGKSAKKASAATSSTQGSKEAANAETEDKKSNTKTIIFKRTIEPNEQAFSLLVPKGWRIEGGIIRVNPMAQGGPAQSIAAKVDFAVKRDDAGSAMLRWLPDILYCDTSRTIAGQMGLFPPGSNYSGMPVYPVMSAQDFLTKLVFPQIHPQSSNVKVVEQRSLPKLVQKYQQQLSLFQIPLDFSYDAAVVAVTYEESGVRYKEKLITVIEDMGQAGGGIWDNKETLFFRGPASEFDQLEHVASIIQGSVKLNLQWIEREIRGQIRRGEIVLKTQRYIQDIDRQIVEHRQKTNVEINNDMFLVLTEQEEYINPYTNEVEIGSDQWEHRWVNESGDVVYSSDANYNPNHDSQLNRDDFKRSIIRPR